MADDNEFGIEGLSDFRPIGSGGFSSVYAAWDQGFERWVAVKVLSNLDESGRRRFDRERIIMGRLSQHRDVVTPFRFGYTNNRAPYLVMEYISGGSLESAIAANGSLPWRDAVEYLIPVCDALSFANAEGILHRDIKPDNILLAHGGAKLADFGIAAIREATATSTAYTLAHTAPETFIGGSDQRDERSDIYSLVSTLYTALTGQPPFHVDGHDSQPAYLMRIANNPLPPLSSALAPPGLIDLVNRALAKDPAARPQTAADLRDELIQIQRSPGASASAPSGFPPAEAFPSIDPPTVHSSEPVQPLVSPSTYTPPGVIGTPGSSVESPPPGVGSEAYARDWQQTSSPQGAVDSSEPVVVVEGEVQKEGRRRPLMLVALVAVVIVALGGAALAARFIGSGSEDPNDEVTATDASDDGDGGSEDSAPDSQSESASDEEGAPAQPSVTAGEGGHLALLQWQAPSHVNAYLSGSTKDLLAGSLVLEPLAEFAPSGELMPALAAEIPSVQNGGISADQSRITWTLREGLLWSDGSPLTSGDLVFTWEYCTNESTGCAAGGFGGVDSVEALDELTVRISFNEPTPFPFVPFVSYLSPVLQRAQFQECVGAGASSCRDQNFHPVGSGPYRVTEFAADDSVRYELNPNYRLIDDGKPFFATVEISSAPDAETAARAVLENGDADYAWNLQVSPGTLEPMVAGGKGRLVVAFTSLVEHLNLNQTDPNGNPPSGYAGGTNPNPFFHDNPDLAKALSLAIDRQQLVAESYGSNGEPACNMWLVSSQRSTANDWCLTQDVGEANRILDEDLGYFDTDGDGTRELPDGTPLEWDYVTSTNAVRQATQALVKSYWEQIGVRVNLRDEDAGLFFSAGPEASDASLWKFFSDIEMFTNGPVSPDPVEYLGGWASHQIPDSTTDWFGANIPRLASEEFDALYDELSATSLGDPRRNEIVIELNDIISASSGSTIPLVNRGNVSAFADDIQGVGELNAWDSEYYNIEDWFRSE